VSISAVVAEALLSGRADAIIAADRAGIIRFWNPGAERLFGYARQEALEQSLNLIIPERLRQRHWDGYNHVIQTGQSRYADSELLSVPAIRKDGSTISVEFTITPLKDETGKLIGMAAVMRDVTKQFQEMRALKRKLDERQLQHSLNFHLEGGIISDAIEDDEGAWPAVLRMFGCIELLLLTIQVPPASSFGTTERSIFASRCPPEVGNHSPISQHL
jgi:PAS domain S-box-containing protein